MNPIKFTYFGHSCFSVEVGGAKILFDPFITPNEKAASIDVSSIQADFILISHGHWDHLADAMDIAKRTGATVVANWEICEWCKKQGHEKVHPMNSGGKWNFDFGMVKLVQAVHSSSFPDGSYAGNPNGFIISSAGRTFYYSGDTALFGDMKLFGKAFDLDFAILPIGDNFTMNVEEAAHAAKFLKTDQVVGVHFDTFGFIVVNHDFAHKVFEKKGKTLLLPEIGQQIQL